jgi:RNA polymerase sigma-70 factor (ECF subfamily)
MSSITNGLTAWSLRWASWLREVPTAAATFEVPAKAGTLFETRSLAFHGTTTSARSEAGPAIPCATGEGDLTMERSVPYPLLDDEADKSLVSFAVAGDEAAFTVLMDRYRTLMQAAARRTMGSIADADDVVQDVFIIAWEKLSTVHDGEHVKGWLMRAVRNRSIDRLRTGRRDPGVLPFDIPATSDSSPFEVVKLLLQNDALTLALANLPLNQKRAWLMREFAGCTYAVIALELVVPESTVRGLLARSRQTLARDLAAWR